jgi:hypothetical protein
MLTKIQYTSIRRVYKTLPKDVEKKSPSEKPPKRLIGKQWTQQLRYFAILSK